MLITYKGKKPIVEPTVFIAPGAKIIGEVQIGEGSTVWFNTVLGEMKGQLQLVNDAVYKIIRPFIYMRMHPLLLKMKLLLDIT